MASTIQIKRGSGVPGSLAEGELAVDVASQILYVGNTSGVLELSRNTIDGLDLSDGSNTITIQAASGTQAYTLTLPSNDGDADQVLTTDGAGNLTWGAGGEVSITGTPADNQIAVWSSATNVEGSSTLTYDSASRVVTLGGTGGTYLAITEESDSYATVDFTINNGGTNNYAYIGLESGAYPDDSFSISQLVVTASGNPQVPVVLNSGDRQIFVTNFGISIGDSKGSGNYKPEASVELLGSFNRYTLSEFQSQVLSFPDTATKGIGVWLHNVNTSSALNDDHITTGIVIGDNATAGIYAIQEDYAAEADALGFFTGSNTGIIEAMRIDSQGTVTINHELVVIGNTTITNSTTVSIEDSMLKLASNNTVSDSVDIGFYGVYEDTGTKYAGVFRDASDGSGVFKVWTGFTTEPGVTADFGEGALAQLDAVIDGGSY